MWLEHRWKEQWMEPQLPLCLQVLYNFASATHTTPGADNTLLCLLFGVLARIDDITNSPIANRHFLLIVVGAFNCLYLLGFREGVVGFCFLKKVPCQCNLRDLDSTIRCRPYPIRAFYDHNSTSCLQWLCKTCNTDTISS